ncbi:hypothetical protein ACIBHX_44935 [Nonomuraea sp. NPDC050536]|uniref:sulfotransferase-like domain-containing protein n=1 Tax=Nonomuraea sp. NPDC050536 TaxID=3364366 RepID=UPI0037CAEA96
MTVIAMWAHPRAVSTAFLRMMIERGDVTVVHEPLVTLTDWNEVQIPGLDGDAVTLHSPSGVLAHLAKLGADRPVFFKDTLEYRHQYLFDHPEEIAGFRHTFIVRDPAKAIASHYLIKPEVACHEIGYEHQSDLFELAWQATGDRPVVIRAESLLARPAETVAAYCEAVGLPYLPDALEWVPEDRTEWHRTRRWHLDAISSSGFSAPAKEYTATVDNDERLRSYYDHHRPYYDRLVEHALV